MDQALELIHKALQISIGIVNDRAPDVYLTSPEKIALNLAKMLVRDDDRWVEAMYQNGFQHSGQLRLPLGCLTGGSTRTLGSRGA